MRKKFAQSFKSSRDDVAIDKGGERGLLGLRSVLLLVGVALAAVPRDEGVDIELALAPLVVHVPETKLH